MNATSRESSVAAVMPRRGDRQHVFDRPRQTRSFCLRRAWGFTLLELMFTTSLAAVCMSIAVPSVAKLSANTRTRITASELASALRLARVSAVTRNRTAVLALTNASPAYDAAPVPDGSNWLVKLVPSAIASEAVGGKDLIQAATVARQNGVALSGPALVCFDPLGMQVTTPSEAVDLPATCASPGDNHGGPTYYLVSRAGATRQFKVLVYRTGRIQVCEAGQQHAAGTDACP